ncbi:MAG TPA: patatin-like phospholipase family protein [Caldimonas sp.]
MSTSSLAQVIREPRMHVGARRAGARRVNLALQGGGAHGAFTWGVLDRLLEDGRVGFEGLSGTSAGAMNAVVMAHGLASAGRDGARQALEDFWLAVARHMPFELGSGAKNDAMPAAAPMRAWLQWARFFSPAQINPLDLNPLRDIVVAQVDFERLREASDVKLFIAATQANTGKLRIFHTHELSADVVLASACLPTIHRAVEIDGEPYWDGAFAANPAVFPLYYECFARDIVIVLLAPLIYDDTPTTASEIQRRSAELAFNANFLREMRMFADVRRRAAEAPRPGREERRLLRTNFHVIDGDPVLGELAAETRLIASRQLLEDLKELGRKQAQHWLRRHLAHVGRRSSVDLARLFA